MITIKHPDESCNAMQAAFLEQCPADQRRFQELLFTYANIICRYHNRARDFAPTPLDYGEWLEGLPGKVRQGMQEKGFEGCKGVLSFSRYVMEKNECDMKVAVLLSAA